MKIPFDIKYRPQIESGEYKLETEAGFPAKVMDLEYNNKTFGKCIAAKIIEDDGDRALLYTREGKRASIFPLEDGSNIFIVTPKPELTRFEELLWSFLKLECSPIDHIEKLPDSEKRLFHKYAAELLDLARTEIEEELKEKVLHDYWKQASDQCAQARKEAKAEALKDLPRWKTLKDSERIIIGPYISINALGGKSLYIGNKCIPIYMLEKLPGFEED